MRLTGPSIFSPRPPRAASDVPQDGLFPPPVPGRHGAREGLRQASAAVLGFVARCGATVARCESAAEADQGALFAGVAQLVQPWRQEPPPHRAGSPSPAALQPLLACLQRLHTPRVSGILPPRSGGASSVPEALHPAVRCQASAAQLTDLADALDFFGQHGGDRALQAVGSRMGIEAETAAQAGTLDAGCVACVRCYVEMLAEHARDLSSGGPHDV